MRQIFTKFSLPTLMSFMTFLLLSSSLPVLADDPVNLVNDIGPTADCKNPADQVIPTCIFSRPAPTTPLELITGDLTVCNCLEKNNTLFSPFQSTPTVQKKAQSERERLIEIERKKAANSGLVQSTHYAKNEKSLETSLIVYGGGETRKPKKDPTQDEEVPDVRPPEISTNLTSINQISDKNKDWQCVTYQEYSVQRELPSDNTFFQVLRNAEFTPADWNMNDLRSKFDQATGIEKEKISIKLTFLSRNPIFQSVMKAQPTAKNTAAKILAKQNELFGILRTLNPAEGSTCFTIPNGCFQEVHNSGAYSNYTSKVGQYLLDKEVISIASEQAANDYMAELEKISTQGDLVLNSVPTDPEGYFNYLQSANRDIATSCAGETAQASCYTQFNQHCTYLRAIDARVKQGIKLTSQDLMSGLREETSLHLNLDPELNPNFKSFNDKICIQPFRNANGESLNFFQYQTQKCFTGSSLPECSDRKALLKRFLTEHNVDENIADVNLRTGFSSLLGDAKYMDVSLAQVAAANNITESPDELLARFGGEFPSISPEGNLVPPAPSVTPSIVPGIAGSSAQGSPSSDSEESSSPLSSSTSSSTSNFASASMGSNDSSGSNSAVRGSNNSGAQTSLQPDLTPLNQPLLNQTRSNYIPPFVNTRIPASIDSDESDNDSERESLNATVPSQVRPPVAARNSGAGGSAVAINGNVSANSVSADSPVSANGAPEARRTSGVSSRKKSSGQNLLFKYGLDGNNQPEITLVSPTSAETVKVGVDRNLMDRIKSNPNALEIGKEELDQILATPDAEVKLQLEAINGTESLTVYAKKDDSGGISFSLKPNRLPASTKKPVRVNVSPDVYDNIASDPDVYLNQNSTLINEIESKPGSLPILQVVSPGKKALIYEVTKTDEFMYHFKLKNK
jgi:hypothetical protein